MKYVLLTLLFFITISGFCQKKTNFPLNRGETEQQKYFSQIPFEFTQGSVIISVQLNGQSYRFIIDTGAPTSISERLYTALHSETINRLKITDSSNKNDSLNVVLLKNIKVGDVVFTNTAALVIPDSSFLFRCFNLDGIIGSNTLRQSVIQFSYPRKIITLTNSSKKLGLRKKEASKLFLTPNQSSPLFWLPLKGKDKARVQLLFDSGMNGLFDLSLRHYTQLKKYELFTNVLAANGAGSLGLWGVANDTVHYKMTVAELNFKTMQLQNALITTTKTDGSRIGAELLKYAEITLDYGHKRIYFTPVNTSIQNIYEKQFPIQPIIKHGKLQVGFVWEPNLVPGISQGDQIMSINEIDCSTMDDCELLFLSKLIDKDEYEIVCKHADNTISTIFIERK